MNQVNKEDEKTKSRLNCPSTWVSSILLVIMLISVISYFYAVKDYEDYLSPSLIASIAIFSMGVAYWLDIILMDRGTNRKETEERIGLDLLNWFRYEVNNKPYQEKGKKENNDKQRDTTSGIRTYLEHVLIVFFLAFALAFLGSIEELMHIHMEGSNPEKHACLTPQHIWIFVSYALLESSLVALLAIEFTTAFFVRHHEKSESLVASLIIAGVLDIVAFVLIKTVIAQPSIPLTDPGAGLLGYIPDYEIAILLAGLMVLSFISSFGAINQAQIFVNAALDDHRNFLRISERLVTLSGGIYRDEGLRETSENDTQSDWICDQSKNRMDDEVWGMEYISSKRACNTINVIIELSKPERYGGVGSKNKDEKK